LLVVNKQQHDSKLFELIKSEINLIKLTFVTSNSRTFPLILSANAAVNEIVLDKLCASCVITCNAGLKAKFSKKQIFF